MTQASHIANIPAFSFRWIFSAGAMIATLLVIAFACIASPDSAVRAHLVSQVLEVILLSLTAAVLARALHEMALRDYAPDGNWMARPRVGDAAVA